MCERERNKLAVTTHTREHTLIRNIQFNYFLPSFAAHDCNIWLFFFHCFFLSLTISMSHVIASKNSEYFRWNRSNEYFHPLENPELYTAQSLEFLLSIVQLQWKLQYEWENRTYLIGNVFCFWCIFIWDIHFAQKITFCLLLLQFLSKIVSKQNELKTKCVCVSIRRNREWAAGKNNNSNNNNWKKID